MGKTHVIDGVIYVEVGRMANAGEKVVCGDSISTVKYIDSNYYIVECDGAYSGRDAWYVTDCRALEPLESTPDVTDLLANLANRVHSLEQQLRDTQSNVERQAEELAHFDYAINTVAYRISRVQTRVEENEQTQSVEVVTFEKFLDSIADKVAERLVGQSRMEGGR
jgi:hypothetical protein